MSRTANEPAAVATDSSALTGGSHHQVATDPNPFQVPPSRVGLYMTSDHDYYVNGEGPKISVTTALEVLDRPELTQWKMNQTALAAALHLGDLIGLSVEDAQKKILGYERPERIRTDAAYLGTNVHTLTDMPLGASEIDSKAFEVPPEVFPYLEAYRGFLGWLDQHGGEVISSEKAIWNKTEDYCGTYDRLILFHCSCHKGLWLVDLKSGKGYYPDYGLQLSGYAHGEYIVLPDDPKLYPMPTVERTALLHLRPDIYEGPMQMGWRLVEYPTTDRDYVAFLAALELYRWKKEGRFTKSNLKGSIYKPIEKGI